SARPRATAPYLKSLPINHISNHNLPPPPSTPFPSGSYRLPVHPSVCFHSVERKTGLPGVVWHIRTDLMLST
ncbi:uncharacterized, partial [Tachysurus ichikawai]